MTTFPTMVLKGIAYKVLQTRDYSKLYLWIPKLLFTIAGIWPKSKHFKLTASLSCVIHLSNVFLLQIGILNNTKYNIKVIDEYVFNLFILMGCFQTYLKAFFTVYNSKNLVDIIDDILLKFWPYDLTGDDLKFKMKLFYSTVTVVNLSIIFLIPFFAIGLLVTPILREGRTLPFNVKYFFNFQSSPIYELLYTSQLLVYTFSMAIVIGLDCLFMNFIAATSAQYRILQKCFSVYNSSEMIQINNKLNNLLNKPSKPWYDLKKDYLVKCIDHHKLLLRFTKKVHKFFDSMILIQLGSSIINICLTIFFITTQKNSEQIYLGVVLSLGLFDQLLLYCLFGNELNYQASQLPEFIFRCNWRDLKNKENVRDIIFLIHHSQRTLPFSAYNLYNVDMRSYVNVQMQRCQVIYTFIQFDEKT